jgi:hypothetical protein
MNKTLHLSLVLLAGVLAPARAAVAENFATLLNGPEIAAKAAASRCAKHFWKPNRGIAPVGYIRGMAMTYGKSFCERKSGADSAVRVIGSPLGDKSADTLAWYKANGFPMSDPLRDVYTLAIAEGMMESAGNPTEGRDTTVTSPTPESAEAGLFQSSFDSFNKDPSLKKLSDAYKAHPEACHLDVFMQRVRDKRSPVFGTGPAADFQKLTKECPAFATEYALVLLRVLRKHFGPITRLQAEFLPECGEMLAEIEATVRCAE